MARQLTPELIEELKEGRYKKLLEEIIRDPELSLEIRVNGEAKVYYSKGLILTLTAGKKPKLLDPKYIKDGRQMPEFNSATPQKYLSEAKELVRAHSKKLEFSIQQNIAMSNQYADSEYFIIDMEYQFPQNDIPPEQRLSNKTRIDLVGVERGTGDIILFELKQGLSALSGKSGADDHFKKTMEHIGDNRFCETVRKDVSAIIRDKKELGLISADAPEPKPDGKIKMIYIFAYNNDRDKAEYDRRHGKYETLYIDTRYKLSSAK